MTTYYVDSSAATDGSGTISSPFKTIANHIGALVAGDIMYLRGGATAGARRTYNETVTPASSGASGNPITLASYPGEFVRLTGPAGAAIINVSGRSWWVFTGDPSDNPDSATAMHFQVDCADRTSTGYGVYLRSSANDNIVRYLEVFNGSYNPALVRINAAHRNKIQYCRIWDNAPSPETDRHGVHISTSSTTPCDDNIVEYSTIYDCGGDCIQIENTTTASGGYISRTIIRYNHLYTTLGGASENAIDIKDGWTTEIYENVIHGFRKCDGTLGGSGTTGEAITLHYDAQDVLIYNNICYDTSGPFVLANSVPGVVIHHNLVYGVVQESTIDNKYLIFIANEDALIYNNTLVGKNGTGASIRIEPGAEATVRNNIVEDGAVVLGSGATLAASNNGWFNTTAGSFAGSGDVTGTTAGFVSKAGNNYHLAADSPCINAGIDVGYVYQGAAPDLGMYEYSGGGDPPASSVFVLLLNRQLTGGLAALRGGF